MLLFHVEIRISENARMSTTSCIGHGSAGLLKKRYNLVGGNKGVIHAHPRIYILSVILLVWTSSCKSPDFAGGEKGWVLLGERKANHLSDKDVFNIQSRNKFMAIQLYVEGRDIEIKDLEIMLINGDVLKPSIETTIRQRERSRIIDLAADGRQLEKITIVYRSHGKLFSRKGKVQIGGRPHNPNDNY